MQTALASTPDRFSRELIFCSTGYRSSKKFNFQHFLVDSSVKFSETTSSWIRTQVWNEPVLCTGNSLRQNIPGRTHCFTAWGAGPTSQMLR